VKNRLDRRAFLKGLGTGAGALMVSGVAHGRAAAQQVTDLTLYARLAGSGTPAIALGRMDTEAWICLGEKVELFWVTTGDVSQVSFLSDLGTFAADAGGSENGLKWGSVEVEPEVDTSFQVEAVGGNFDAGTAASVRVFGRKGDGVFQRIEEGIITAAKPQNRATDIFEFEDWEASLPESRFSPDLRVTDIKPLGKATEVFPFDWRIVKVDANGAERRFNIAPVSQYQRPFTPAGTNETIPLAGDWTFSSNEAPPNRTLQFMVRLACA